MASADEKIKELEKQLSGIQIALTGLNLADGRSVGQITIDIEEKVKVWISD